MNKESLETYINLLECGRKKDINQVIEKMESHIKRAGVSLYRVNVFLLKKSIELLKDKQIEKALELLKSYLVGLRVCNYCGFSEFLNPNTNHIWYNYHLCNTCRDKIINNNLKAELKICQYCGCDKEIVLADEHSDGRKVYLCGPCYRGYWGIPI